MCSSDLYRNVATDGTDSLLVPPGDADALGAAIGRLLSDPVLSAGLVEAGQRRADDFSMRTLADRYVERSSPLHRADASVKLPAVLAYVLALAFTREAAWGVLAASALPVVLAAALGGFSPMFLLRRSILALPFVAAAVPLAFTRPGDTVFIVPLAGWDASREGIEAVATILARSWL